MARLLITDSLKKEFKESKEFEEYKEDSLAELVGEGTQRQRLHPALKNRYDLGLFFVLLVLLELLLFREGIGCPKRQFLTIPTLGRLAVLLSELPQLLVARMSGLALWSPALRHLADFR
jgi:hypothetical protein